MLYLDLDAFFDSLVLLLPVCQIRLCPVSAVIIGAVAGIWKLDWWQRVAVKAGLVIGGTGRGGTKVDMSMLLD